MVDKNDRSRAMAKEMRQFMSQAQALVDATSGELDDRIKTTRDALKARLEAAQGEYGELADRLLDKVQTADAVIHDKPYYAIGGTFLAGLLLGWLMSRK